LGVNGRADFEVRCSIPYRILFTTFTATSPTGEGFTTIDVMNSDGSDVQVLKELAIGQRLSYLAWLPDARYIAYWQDNTLILMNSDGTGATPVFITSKDPDEELHWSPDGSRIVFFLSGSNDLEMYVISLGWDRAGAAQR
jgi:Tol biopolymer transport system component